MSLGANYLLLKVFGKYMTVIQLCQRVGRGKL